MITENNGNNIHLKYPDATWEMKKNLIRGNSKGKVPWEQIC
jgi:hypothetical protein